MKKIYCILISVLVMVVSVSCGNTANKKFVESYEGPIIPLIVMEPVDGVEIKREISFDFTDYDYTKFGITNYDFVNDDFYASAYRSVKVNDKYVLHNVTDQDMNMQVAYSFMGKLMTRTNVVPVLEMNGGNLEYDLVLGHTLVYEYDEISSLHNRECYEQLLSTGNYIEESINRINGTSEQSQKVTVYKIEVSDNVQEDLRGSFQIQKGSNEANVYCYGVHTFSNANGIDTLEFDVSEGTEIYVVTDSADVQVDEILCYTTQNKTYLDWKEGIFDLEVYESTQEDVLLDMIEDYLEKGTVSELGDLVSDQLFMKMAKQYLDSEGIVAIDGAFGTMMDEYRMCFQVVDITVPAGATVEFEADFIKPASVVGVDKKPYDCYELMSLPNANVEFLEETIKVVGAEDVVIAELTSGDKFENGSYEITLDGDDFQIYIDEKTE